MQGFKFHAEMPEERSSKSASKAFPHAPWTRATLKRMADAGKHVNVCAVATDPEQTYLSGHTVVTECISSLFDRPNSPVCGSSAAREYLSKRTVRIDEATARKLHPALFEYLDALT